MNPEDFSPTPTAYRRSDPNHIRNAAQLTILHKYKAEVDAEVLQITRRERMLETAIMCLQSGVHHVRTIKILRTAFFDTVGDSLGLKEAKDIVDSAAAIVLAASYRTARSATPPPHTF